MVAIPTLLSTRAAVDEQIGRLEVHTFPIPAARSISRCCPTGPMPMTEFVAGDAEPRWPRSPTASPVSTPAIPTPPAPIASSCSIAAASGTRRSAGGSAGSASAASCTSSIVCCAARPTRRFSKRATASLPADVRYVVTLDFDTRLPRDAIPRLVGKMAHPLNRPRLDSARAPRRRGLRRAAAARDAVAAGRRRRLAVPAHLLEQQRHRSLFVGGVGRLPGPVRRGLLLRQGHLRHRCLRGRPAGPRPRQHDAEPRSLRGRVRPLGPGVRHRGGRGISRPLRRGRGAPASLGARRLAAAAVDARPA